MTMARTVAEVLCEHVSLEVECIDRMYLNLYVPMLQRPEGAAHFFLLPDPRGHRRCHSVAALDYKHTRIKQYHKEGRALRTETTSNDTYDFEIGRRLQNLSKLRQVGFAANRRPLDVQRINHDCSIGEDAFKRVHQPILVDGQRGSALRFGDPRVLALLSALVIYRHLPRGFTNQGLRNDVAQLLGLPPGHFTQGKMTYDLRRLRLHGLIERIPHSHRYRMTSFGGPP